MKIVTRYFLYIPLPFLPHNYCARAHVNSNVLVLSCFHIRAINKYVGPPYCRDKMYAGRVSCRVSCCFLVTRFICRRDRQTDGQTLNRYITLSVTNAASVIELRATDLRTVFAVGVDVAEWAATSVAVFVGVASASIAARLSGTRVIAVAYVDAGQCLLEQLHRPLVDHHLHSHRSSWQHHHHHHHHRLDVTQNQFVNCLTWSQWRRIIMERYV